MAPEGNGKGRDEVKLSCSFDKRVKPKNLQKVKPYREKNTAKINEVESTPVGKRKQGITNSGSTPVERKRLKKEHGKMRRYLMKSQHTASGTIE